MGTAARNLYSKPDASMVRISSSLALESYPDLLKAQLNHSFHYEFSVSFGSYVALLTCLILFNLSLAALAHALRDHL
jgi:hypothetical protein